MFPSELQSIASAREYQEFRDNEFRAPTQHQELHVRRCNFLNLGLKEWSVHGCSIMQSRFSDCYMRKAVFHGVDFTGTSFDNCDLSKAEFENCTLEYVRFSNCRLNYANLLKNLPGGKNNLKRALLRNLRLNAQAEGDAEWATRLLLKELTTSRKHEFDVFVAEGHFVDRSALQRIQALVRWLLAHLQNAVWGYGLRPGRLLLNGVFVMILFAAIYLWPAQSFRANLVQMNRKLTIVESTFLSATSFSTLGTTDFSPLTSGMRFAIATEGILGAVFIGLLAASAFRRMAR
jgi:hypothetical protein